MPEDYQKDLDDHFIKMDYVGINYYFSRRTEYDPEKFLLCKSVQEVFFSAPGQSYPQYPAGLFEA